MKPAVPTLSRFNVLALGPGATAAFSTTTPTAGAIGAACGAGFGILAVMATVLAAIILFVVGELETYAESKQNHPSDSA